MRSSGAWPGRLLRRCRQEPTPPCRRMTPRLPSPGTAWWWATASSCTYAAIPPRPTPTHWLRCAKRSARHWGARSSDSVGGRLALITGVGRAGQVGESVARAFAQRKNRLVLVSRDLAEVTARAKALETAGFE